MGNYYCGVKDFWKSFFCPWQMKTLFWSPKSCFSDAATAIILTTNAFWRWYTHRGRLKCSIVIKENHFLELQSYFSGISIDFHPQGAIEFTATTAVF